MPLTEANHQTQHNFVADVEIISVHGSQLTKKSLMKIESLPTQKSSTQHNFAADSEIVNATTSQLTMRFSVHTIIPYFTWYINMQFHQSRK